MALLTALLIAGGAPAQDHTRRIPLDEAQALAQEAMNFYHPGAFLEYMPLFDDGFYEFAALSDNPVASPNVGRFAVNPWTGDVWDAAGFCERLTSPSLEMRQQAIRERFEFAADEYADLRAKKPVCDATW
jgi:hypothetical protein